MSDFLDFFKVGLLVALIISVPVMITFQCVYSMQNVPLRVYLDGKEVYHGRSACVETKSVGSSSQVNVGNGPWCMFPKEYFAGKNLVIQTEDRR